MVPGKNSYISLPPHYKSAFNTALYNLHHLFPQEDEAVIYFSVIMVVAKEPVVEIAETFDLLVIICQPVVGIERI